MGVDYTALAAVSERLIEENGRAITLVAEPRTKVDPTMPWKGPILDEVDPDYVAPVNLELFGVFVPPNQVRIFGLSSLGKGTEFVDLMAFSDQVIISYPTQVDLTPYTAVLESDGSRWGVVAYQLLKPAEVQLLSFIGVRR